jgi:conjugative transfer signal peptidase TraF
MQWLNHAIVLLCKVVIVLLTTCIGAGIAGARINHTFSYPVGLYWTTSKKPDKGDLVFACPPYNAVVKEAKLRGYLSFGHCRGEVEQVIKRIVAVRGDAVTITEQGVTVNGQQLSNSIPKKTDRGGRTLEPYSPDHFVVAPDEALLMSEYSDNSFDGRYFGPVGLANIEHSLRPVLTWNKGKILAAKILPIK